MPPMASRAGLAAAVVLAACHVTTRTEVTRTGGAKVVERPETARAQPATIEVTPDGKLRFVEPLVCDADVFADVTPEIQVARRPNYASVVVGIVAFGIGAVATVVAATGDDAASSPVFYGGIGLLAAGGPLAIAPLVGNRTTTEPGELRRELQGKREAPCGVRPVEARAATLAVRDLRVFGAIQPDGVFAVSPFQWIDAFAVGEIPAWDIRARFVGTGEIVERVLDASRFNTAAPGFLASAGVDGSIEPLRKVPNVSIGTVRVTRTSAPALRIAMPVVNAGPGVAWQLRARVSAPHAEVDGRILYLGRIAPNESRTGELIIPLSADADTAIRGAKLPITLVLVDGHRTVALTARFDGAVNP
jgi:hypothetical protein